MDGVRGYTSQNYDDSTVKALVVDDTPSYAKLVTKLLERAGVGVKAFYDPREALEYARTHSEYNIAIIDLDMPGIRGNKLERELRSLPGKRDLKVIIPTAKQEAVDNYDAERLCRRGKSRTQVLNKIVFSQNPKKYLDDVLAA
jgi:CheY-like chemotaxis protein